MLFPDILLNPSFDRIALIVSIIGIIVSVSIFANYPKTNITIALCIVVFMLCLTSLIIFSIFFAPNAHVYQLLREQSEPSSWETYQIASDFNQGRTLFMTGLAIGYILLYILLTLVIVIILIPMFIVLQDFSGILEVSILISSLFIITLYILTLLGNCTFFWINPQIQFILFRHSDSPPIVPFLLFENKENNKYYSNKCSIITIDEITDIAHHPFTNISPPIARDEIRVRLEDELERLKHDDQLAEILSPKLTLTWLSPTADIIGVSTAFYTLVGGLLSIVKKIRKAEQKPKQTS